VFRKYAKAHVEDAHWIDACLKFRKAVAEEFECLLRAGAAAIDLPEVDDGELDPVEQGSAARCKCEQLRYRVLICTSSLEGHKLNYFSILLLIKGAVVVNKKASTAVINSFRQAYVCNNVKYLR
jgi:hypothetical protein